ncbi:hypothetical protein O9X90_14490 [Agrobacterium leguminum]|uniref:phage tail terminator protein n=1 Tax=Agrobacterium leguminum TaxID=2792015 RepID=UPI0022B83B67|nr:hypothetical protein [Agrobacterium leguminum]MCZ7933524.1 hypothetical protein [Agrobacterium leguminum]
MIDTIIARLLENDTPFAIAGGAAELADVKDRPVNLPAVYVYISHEKSAPNERINTLLQRTAFDVAIVIVTENLSQGDNAAARGDIEALKTFVRGQLLGFLPAGATDPMEHVEGEIQQALNGVVWFEDVFTSAYYQEKR